MNTQVLKHEPAKVAIYSAVGWLAKCFLSIEKKALAKGELPPAEIRSSFEIDGRIWEITFKEAK